MDDIERFTKLVTGGYCCISIVTYEEQYALELVRQVALGLNRDLWIWSVAGGVRDGLLAESLFIADTESPAAGLRNFTNAKEGSICLTLDLAEYLKGGMTLRILRDIIELFKKNGRTLVMIDKDDKLPDVIRSFARPFAISFPDKDELKEIIRKTLQRFHRKKPIEVGISQRGFDTIIRNLSGLTRRQAEQIIVDTVTEDRRFDDDDINDVIANKRRIIQRGGLLEYIQTPLDLSEIGGMRHLKKWLEERKKAFTSKAEEFGLRAPRGVLMLGVQGAGKSLCAKAIATAWHQPLLRLDPSALYASYIGESERNLRDALHQTEAMAPVILWIDEIEKGFASAASQSTDGGLSKRMFGTLLTWMQEHEAPVFVIATANDIEALPPELLRKGRFDEIFFVDLPTEKVRKEIFAIHLRKRGRDPEKLDLAKMAKISDGFSGSEIEQAIISALHEAYASETDLNTNGIVSALRTSPPLSVTMAESVQCLRDWAEGRCVPAD
ncbi:MAG: AAA family ATPase [Phycisphaerae bacterium]|nr:AAA family ATPase [Phycisphaerae bacterium]NIP55134.1 AAA family ATPase [Phycisphaerae bacterium]NIS53824.1 AAA family ATPase [Phycisphaerae bacterium]NIU11420.1 AAA family ATPase [Phycisphaerae bacterium]NIU59662.1 AAA family ATPase [Phycisphaerae bacterium]